MSHSFRFVICSLLMVPLLVLAADKKPTAPPDYRTLVTTISATSVTLMNQFDKKKKVYTITAETVIQLNDAVSTIDAIKTGMQMETFRLGSTTVDPPELAELDVKDATPAPK